MTTSLTGVLDLANYTAFSAALFERMRQFNAALGELELYEFRYGLDNLTPETGWQSVDCPETGALLEIIHQPQFFEAIELKPKKDGRIVLDEKILWLTRILMVGLATGTYSAECIDRHFYFDVRGFFFLVRTEYFPASIMARFGGSPYARFSPAQKQLETLQDLGFKEFNAANQSINHAFIGALQALIAARGTPLLLAIVGPTAAGKTEIVAQLSRELALAGKTITTIEMDNFYKDREFRDGKPLNEEVIHFSLFTQCIHDLLGGKPAQMPRYDFVEATSSHDLDGNLRPGQTMMRVEPADILLLEGNFPFHIPQIAPWIGIKVVYLTDDPIRLKRKWRRDVDYRKKYDPRYLCNRYFRTQFLRAQEVYLPMMETCDIVVDTTGAALWLTPEAAAVAGKTVTPDDIQA